MPITLADMIMFQSYWSAFSFEVLNIARIGKLYKLTRLLKFINKWIYTNPELKNMIKKDFINNLYKENSEFQHPKHAEMLANALEAVSSDIYTESQRFIFELIQNADDAALNDSNEVYFNFCNSSLMVSHNGKSFDEADINGITSFGKGTKVADDTKTGYKGIGFKSVFGKSNRVTIISDGYSFRFDRNEVKSLFGENRMPWQIIPIWTELSHDMKGTSVQKKYNVSTIIELESPLNLKDELNELLSNGKILLFLRKISKISISINGNLDCIIKKQINKTKERYDEVVLFKNDKELSNWIVTTFDKIPIDKDTQLTLMQDEKTPGKLKEAKFTEISFAAKIENGKLKEIKGEESLIFTYLPTKVSDFEFPFLVNGSFLTNASREGIHEDREWNKWLFKLIGEKIFDWLELLSQSKFKYQMLYLLPKKFNSKNNELKISFDKSFDLYGASKCFIPNNSSQLKKVPEILIDKTGLSELDFIPINVIIEYINSKYGKIYSVSSFIDPKLESNHKLKSLGAHSFDLENLEDFFVDEIFKTNHQPSLNFSLIKYFYEKANNFNDKEFNEKLKAIPFICSEENILRTPQSICFPTVNYYNEIDEGVTLIHNKVYNEIELNHKIKSWLESLGVKDPSDIAYVENELIGNIDNCINESNYLKITRFLFSQYKKELLEESHFSKLSQLKLYTINDDFAPASCCYLSDNYEPKLCLEKLIPVGAYISENYIKEDDLPSEWKSFFIKLGVSQDISVVRNKFDRSEVFNKYQIFSEFFDKNSSQVYTAKSGNVWNNPINKYWIFTIPFIEQTNDINISKVVWNHILSKEFHRDRHDMGIAQWQNKSFLDDDFLEWCMQNSPIFPNNIGETDKAANIFINYKEIIEIGGKYLSILKIDNSVSEEWLKIIPFKTKIELEDYLAIIEAIENDTDSDEELKNENKKRLGLIYNKLTSQISHLSEQKKKKIAEWAECHKLLCDNGRFENAHELIWVNNDGFTNTSEHLKLLFIPENCEINTNDFGELLQLFGVQIIDLFIPYIKNKLSDVTLKIQLQVILPFFTAILERKHYVDYSVEFKRLSEIIDNTEFYTASEIVLSFKNRDEIISGPSLDAYLDESELSYKGKWTSQITLFALIPELLKRFKLSGLSDELKLLIQLDENEIKQWLVKQGYELTYIQEKSEYATAIEKVKSYIAEDDIEQSFDLVDNSDEKSRISISQDAKETIFETLKRKGFNVTDTLDINYTIVKGITNPSGLPVKIVVKSGKAGKLYFNPSEWLALTEDDTQLFVVSRGNIVRNITLNDLSAINDTFHMRFNTQAFAVNTNLKAFANFFRYLPYTHFIFETPESTTDYLQQFGLGERNPSSKELSSDDKNLLH